MTQPLILAGAIGSPYSRKMRSLLRYRRIPFQWIGMNSTEQQKLPPAPLPLIPVLYWPQGDGYEATSDSTLQIERLEAEFSERSTVPMDGAVAFLDYLIEDYADEWVTKMMFHYRWAIAENAENAGRILPRWNLAVPEKLANEFAKTFTQRQIDRLAVVGSNETTGATIESSYARLLDILERHFRDTPFVMGSRPGTADFGLFGQLSQLVQVEPTSQILARRDAPRVVCWCDVIEDLSGLSVDDRGWVTRDAVGDSLRDLFTEIGRTYVPFLLSNAAALDSGADHLYCQIDGRTWRQTPFRYQGKCRARLREAYAALADRDRSAVDAALAGTGCEALCQ